MSGLDWIGWTWLSSKQQSLILVLNSFVYFPWWLWWFSLCEVKWEVPVEFLRRDCVQLIYYYKYDYDTNIILSCEYSKTQLVDREQPVLYSLPERVR